MKLKLLIMTFIYVTFNATIHAKTRRDVLRTQINRALSKGDVETAQQILPQLPRRDRRSYQAQIAALQENETPPKTQDIIYTTQELEKSQPQPVKTVETQPQQVISQTITPLETKKTNVITPTKKQIQNAHLLKPDITILPDPEQIKRAKTPSYTPKPVFGGSAIGAILEQPTSSSHKNN